MEEEKKTVKTLREDFFEKFPKAPRLNGRTPFPCAKHIYPDISCVHKNHNVMCKECWDRPLEV